MVSGPGTQAALAEREVHTDRAGRAWRTALATIGLGAVALGVDDSLKLGILGFVGVVLILGGVGMLVVAVRPQSSR